MPGRTSDSTEPTRLGQDSTPQGRVSFIASQTRPNRSVPSSLFHIIELIDTEHIDPAVAGNCLGEHLLVRGFDEFVHEPGGERISTLVPLLCDRGGKADEEVGFAGAGIPNQAEGPALADPVPGGQRVDGGGIDVRVGVEVEAPEPLVPEEVRSIDNGRKCVSNDRP